MGSSPKSSTSSTSSTTQDPPIRTRWSRHGHVPSFGDGRVCSNTDCGTTLSRYNAESLCSVHDPEGGRRRR